MTTLRRALVLLAALSSCSECQREREPPPRAQPVVGRGWATPPLEVGDGGVAADRLPRVIHRGGPFLRNPAIVTVTFAGDDPALTARLEELGDTLTTTAWWRAVVDSYCLDGKDCVGEGLPGGHARLAEALPAAMRVIDVNELLKRAAAAGQLLLPKRDALVVVYLPAGVTLSDAHVPMYCDGPRAFHSSLTIGGREIAYAVLPRCGGEAEMTATASHEILEATTNPDPSARGFAFKPGSAHLGFTASGIEPVDPCGLITRDRHRTTERGFTLQRAWSNREAALGHDPCVPSRPGQPYLALVPATPTVRLGEPGASVTIDVEAFADRAVPAWSVSAVDVFGDRDGTSYVEARVDEAVVEAGQRAKVTIALRKRHPNELAIVGLVSTLAETTHLWPVAVVTR